MQEQTALAQLDSLLRPFVEADSESAAQDELEPLIALITPLVKRITARGRSPEDDFQESLRQTLVALRQCRQAPQQFAIGDFQRYVSVVASHVTRRHWRTERPVFQQLKESLRMTLRNESQLALWQGENSRWLCGLKLHISSIPPVETPTESRQRLLVLLTNPSSCADDIFPKQDASCVPLSELLKGLFDWLGHSLAFDQLTPIVFALRRLNELTTVSDNDEDDNFSRGQWIDTDPLPPQRAEWAAFLKQLWEEIEQLPPLQRIAYLLNFTAGEGALEIFKLNGVASIRRIGQALQLTDEQFARVWADPDFAEKVRPQLQVQPLRHYDEKFACLWQYLPLNDLTIARLLGTERQKVINLRKAAGDRLARRLSDFRKSCE